MSDDDDFWTTWIASTPEDDQRFAGCGRIFAWLLVALLALIAVASLI